jgi:hypothetical protein
MIFFFLLIAGLTFLCGSGVALFPIVYGICIVAVFATSTILQDRYPYHRVSLLIVSSSTLLAVLIGEIVLRVAWDEKLYYRSHEKFFERSTEYEGRYRYTPNISTTRRIYGDLAAISGEPKDKVFRNERFVTDDRGFRNFTPDNPSEPTKILILGDSYGVGSDTTQELTWPVLLRQNLGGDVRNLSLPGSPADELYTLLTELPNLSLSKDAVVVWMIFSGNDLKESFRSLDLMEDIERRRLPFFDSLMVKILNFHHRSALSRLIEASRANGTKPRVEYLSVGGDDRMLVYRPYLEMSKLTRQEVEQLPAFNSFTATMEKMKETSCKNGFSVLVVLAPSKEEVYARANASVEESAVAASVSSLCRRLSFEVLDLGPIMVRASNDKSLWWRDDTHWNAEGNSVAAEAIGARLKNGLTASPSCDKTHDETRDGRHLRTFRLLP